MIELLLPQLKEILPIVTDHVKDLINNGTVKNLYEIYSRDENTYCKYNRLHLDKPNPSYKFIEIGDELRTPMYSDRQIPVQYIKWEKDGVRYYIQWDMDPKGSRWGTVTSKFLFFRWNSDVLLQFRKIVFIDFESTDDNASLHFGMSEKELDKMSVGLHDKLCGLLAAQKYQYENVENYISAAVERMHNDATQNTLRHFEKLLTPPGESK